MDPYAKPACSPKYAVKWNQLIALFTPFFIDGAAMQQQKYVRHNKANYMPA
jgi:hypothetical protein